MSKVSKVLNILKTVDVYRRRHHHWDVGDIELNPLDLSQNPIQNPIQNLLQNKRDKHLHWDLGDVVPKPLGEKLGERKLGTFDEPVPDPLARGRKHNVRRRYQDDAERQALSFEPRHMDAVRYYKRDSSDVNHPLRQHPGFGHEDNPIINTLDEVTSHPTSHHIVAFRSVSRALSDSLKPGDTFTDHGFTGATLDSDTARSFSNLRSPKHLNVIAKIHIPKGTKGHYIDHTVKGHNFDHEHEYLLHRGTKFQVLGHSEAPPEPGSDWDGGYHVVHMKVVGQESY